MYDDGIPRWTEPGLRRRVSRAADKSDGIERDGFEERRPSERVWRLVRIDA